MRYVIRKQKGTGRKDDPIRTRYLSKSTGEFDCWYEGGEWNKAPWTTASPNRAIKKVMSFYGDGIDFITV